MSFLSHRIVSASMTAQRRHLIIAGLALAALGAVTVFQWWDATRVQQQDERVTQIREMRVNLAQLLSPLQDVGTSALAFVVTGDSASLDRFAASVNTARSRLRVICTIAGDNPNQQAHCDVLGRLIDERVAVAQTFVDRRRDSGFEAARQVVAGGEGKTLIDQIRAEIAGMDVEEQTELNQLSAAARVRRRGARAISAALGGLSFLMFAGVLALMLRQAWLRQQAQTEIAQLNVGLEQRAAKLAAANTELESFSYSVSHDLRAPLRHVHGYVEMLQRATDGQLSEEAQRYLNIITEASVEMGQLIDDLLAFSRMGRAEMRESRVRLDEVVQDTIRALEMASPGRNIVWRTAPLPPVVGDPALIKQVLANLIGNAVKYSRMCDPAEIEIGCTGEEDGRIILFVRDNGAGFDMQYAHKLFGVFQRLHRAEEFEGTGIGLATVQRIVARHGGRVWAESAVNEGATFYFTLKKSPSA